MSKRILYIAISFPLLWVGLGGCVVNDSPDDPSAETVEMELKLTRGEGDPAPSESTFLFWYGSDMDRIGTGNPLPVPYHIAVPSGDIDDYKDPEPKYATGKPYPINYRRIAAVGYSPNTLVASQNYGVLTIPTDQEGSLDVLASEPVYGSVTAAFSDPMMFSHIQSKISIKAIRVKGMYSFVKYVRLELPYSYLVQNLIWNTTAYRYDCVGFPTSDTRLYEAGQDSSDNMLNSCTDDTPGIADDYRDVGLVHIKPGQTSLKFNVIAQIAPPAEEENILNARYEARVNDIEITFKDAFEQPLTLGRGESYEIIIVFEDGAFTLMGRKCDWNNGGNILIPVPIHNEP